MAIHSADKIVSYEEAVLVAAANRHRRIVIANGCFDILHYGHVSYLEGCRNEGDLLIVGVNTDQAVRLLKGPSRPLNTVSQRMVVLAALMSVDYVCPIDSADVVQFIRDMKANLWIKGGDYTPHTLNPGEVKAANEVGTKVIIKQLISGVSTTNIIAKALR